MPMRPRAPVTAILYALLLLFSGWYVVPFCWALATSVKHPGMVFDGRWLPYARARSIPIDGRERDVHVIEERGDSVLVRVAATDDVRAVPRGALETFSPRWSNYAEAWNIVPFGRYFLNSLLIGICVTLGQLVVCSLGGYAFARLEFPGRDT